MIGFASESLCASTLDMEAVHGAPSNYNRSRGLLYIFPGAGTLRKSASAN
jgi:hypothetical protein